MLSVADIVDQIHEYLRKRPDADHEQLSSALGRPVNFIKSICAIAKVDITKAPPRVVPGKGKKKIKVIGRVSAQDADYGDELLTFQEFCADKDFNFRLGVILAIRNFKELVTTSPGWQSDADHS